MLLRLLFVIGVLVVGNSASAAVITYDVTATVLTVGGMPTAVAESGIDVGDTLHARLCFLETPRPDSGGFIFGTGGLGVENLTMELSQLGTGPAGYKPPYTRVVIFSFANWETPGGAPGDAPDIDDTEFYFDSSQPMVTAGVLHLERADAGRIRAYGYALDYTASMDRIVRVPGPPTFAVLLLGLGLGALLKRSTANA